MTKLLSLPSEIRIEVERDIINRRFICRALTKPPILCEVGYAESNIEGDRNSKHQATGALFTAICRRAFRQVKP